MELTNGDLFRAIEPLKGLMEKKFPIKTSLALAKMAQSLTAPMEIVGQLRQNLYVTYGEVDPQDKSKILVNTQGENFPKFSAELGELMQGTCEVDIEPVALPETITVVCEKCKSIQATALEIEPATLMLLEKFITVG